jgi:hypothetical protein
MTRAKILITGTGRSGTTLLVQVLTDLGLDTGFAPDAAVDPRARAGLERALDDPAGPRIVKSPNVIRRLDAILAAGTIDLEHVIIPIRDLDVAAASRVRTTRYGADLHTQGGLLATRYATRQAAALAVLQHQLMLTLARYEVPHTLLAFPRFTTDWEYTHRTLSFLTPGLSPHEWRDALAARVVPELIHEAPLSRRERSLTVLGTTFNRAVARPLRGAGRLLRGGGRDGEAGSGAAERDRP